MQNLPELTSSLINQINREIKLSSITNVLAQYKGSDWQQLCCFNKKTYNRIKYFANELFEIYLVCWNPKQKTDIHNHPAQGCLLKVLQGCLEECRYDPLTLTELNQQQISTGDVSYIDNKIAYHNVINNFAQAAVSLHIYAPIGFEQQKIDVEKVNYPTTKN